MLVKETPAKPGGKRFPLAEQARALAIVLREEFGVPFAFYDLAAGEPVGDAGGEGLEQLFDPELLAALTADGRASVSPQPGGRYRLALLLYEAGKPVLAAAGELAGLAREGCDGREQARLQKWLQAVCDRLRLADQLLARRRAEEESSAQGLAAWEALLALDHLVRRLRIHKEPTRNQHRVLEAAHGLLGVQSLVWVPLQPDEPVLTHGEFLLAPADCRTLVAALAQCPDFRPPEPLLLNDFAAGPWGARFPQVGNLLAFLVTDQGPLGWVLAVNKKARQADKEGPSVPVSAAPSVASSAFRRSDAVLLTPFVALFELHARGS
ncbi:MAG TPA: hypothetical protein VFA26_24375, partial [Gemmataceae bacterium]|nr:hypothetical protein [Gemmataceae bacterium]